MDNLSKYCLGILYPNCSVLRRTKLASCNQYSESGPNGGSGVDPRGVNLGYFAFLFGFSVVHLLSTCHCSMFPLLCNANLNPSMRF
jgi:hypothetical protein